MKTCTILAALLFPICPAANAEFTVTLRWNPNPTEDAVLYYTVLSEHGQWLGSVGGGTTTVTLTFSDAWHNEPVCVTATNELGTSGRSHYAFLPGPGGSVLMTRVEKSTDLATWNYFADIPRRDPQRFRLIVTSGIVSVEQSNDGGLTWEYVAELPYAPQQFIRSSLP